jgi:hypothetical protein
MASAVLRMRSRLLLARVVIVQRLGSGSISQLLLYHWYSKNCGIAPVLSSDLKILPIRMI